MSTNQEINEAVALKLGWFEVAEVWMCPPGSNEIFSKLPDYCTSIAAAWEIVEKQEYFKLVYAASSWRCEMGKIKEYADTAPMAICLAFLKLP